MASFSWLRLLRPSSRSKGKAARKARSPAPRREALSLEALETRLVTTTFTWIGAGKNSNWSNPANWGGAAPTGNPAEQDNLVFPANAPNTNTVNDLASPVIGSLQFQGSNYHITGNTIQLGDPNAISGTGTVSVSAGQTGITLNVTSIVLGVAGGNRQFFDIGSGGVLTVGSKLTGTSGAELTERGSGTLVLSADNSGYTGQIDITGNSMLIVSGNNKALGDGSSPTTVETGSQLQVQNVTGAIGESLLLNGLGVSNTGALLNLSGSNTWSGPIELDSDAAVGSTSGTLTITGTISDNGSGHNLSKQGPGTVVFASANTYRGTTTVNGGILQIQNAQALGTADGTATTGTTVNQVNPGTPSTLQLFDPTGVGFTVANERLVLNGSGVGGIGALDNNKGNNTWTGSVILGSGSTGSDVNIGSESPYSLTVTGVVQDPNGVFNLTKVGTGEVIFTANNTYRGFTTVAKGILTIKDSHGLGKDPSNGGQGTSVLAGATLELSVAGRTTPDSVSPFTTNTLVVNENLTLAGMGANGLGALYSQSGINTYTAPIALVTSAASIGVAADPHPTASNAYFTNDYSLTTTGKISGVQWTSFYKVGAGQLILPIANTYLGITDIQQGWVTIRNNQSLGATVPGLTDDVQPGTRVEAGASLHLYPLAGQSLNIAENLTLSGNGFVHPYGTPTGTADGISLQGALENLAGVNTLSGTVNLLGQAGIGVDPVFGASQLTQTGKMGEGYLPQNITRTQEPSIDEGLPLGPAAEVDTFIDTGTTSGSLRLNFDMHSTAADSIDVYYGIAGQGGVLLWNSGSVTNPLNFPVGPTGAVFGTYQSPVIAFGPTGGLTTDIIEIVVNKGGEQQPLALPGYPASMWHWNALVQPNPAPTIGGLNKLGSKLLVLQGEATYSGPEDIQQGVMLVQNTSALGRSRGQTNTTVTTNPTTTTVESGAALVLGSNVPALNGGVETNPAQGGADGVGYGIWGEHLVLNGPGNNTLGVPLGALTVLGTDPGVLAAGSNTLVPATFLWRGPVTLNASATILVGTNAGLTIDGVIDDASNKTSPTGSDLIKVGTGELTLSGANTYRGTTYVGTTAANDPSNVNEFFSGSNTAQPGGIVTISNSQALGGPGLAEVVKVTLSSTSGTFTLSVNGVSTGALSANYNDPSFVTNVQNALNALSTVGGPLGGVAIVGTPSAGSFTITLGGNLVGFHQAVTATGSGVTATLTTVSDGAGGTYVTNGAQLQLEGSLTVAGEPLIAQGTGTSAGNTPSFPTNWFAVGPAPVNNGQTAGTTPVAGRVTGVATDPTDPKIIYIATAGGGAWKTVDGGLTWSPLFDNGPALFGGAIAVAPSDPRVIYFGTGEADNSGDSYYGTGIYKSTDSGKTWTLLTDGGVNPVFGLAVSKIVVDQFDPNRIWAATSDMAVNVPANVGAPGIWRYDATGHWFNLTGVVSNFRATQKGQLAAPPNTPGPDDDYRIEFPQSNAVWSDLTLVYFDTTRPEDTLNPPFTYPGMEPAVPVLYAALGIPGGSHMNGVFRSENPTSNSPIWYVGDPGDTPAPDGRPGGEFPTGLWAAPFFDRNGNIKITAVVSPNTHFPYDYPTGANNPPPGFTPNPPNPLSPVYENVTLYAAITYPTNPFEYPDTWGDLREIEKSTDGGKNWTAIAPSGPMASYQGANPGGQGWYDSSILATGADGKTLYVGGVSTYANGNPSTGQLFRSTDGGTTWQDISTDNQSPSVGPHTDQHALALDAFGRIIAGHDGGVSRWDPVTGNWTDINGDLATLELNGISSHPTDPHTLLAASQDNGTEKTTGNQEWTWVDPGDGGIVAFDQQNPNIAYHVRNSALWQSTDGGSTWGANPIYQDNLLYFALVVDPLNHNRLLVGDLGPPNGGPGVSESVDGGKTWIALNPPLGIVTAIAPAQYQGPFDNIGFPNAVDKGASTYDPDTIWITDGASVLLTKDHGLNWLDRTTDLPAPLNGSGNISDVEVDPRNEDVVYITSSAPQKVGGGRVYMTSSAGLAQGVNPGWTDITFNLPDIAVWKLAIDPRTSNVYIGTDNGVWELPANATTWVRLGAGLPNVKVPYIALNQNLNTLSIATYGRSAFQLTLDAPQANSGAIRALSGSSFWVGPVLFNGPTTIQVEGTQSLGNAAFATQLTLSGNVVDLPTGANGKITKTGLGSLVLAGNNTYGGVTEVVAGVLVVANPNALGSTANGTVVDNGAALNLQSNLNAEPLQLSGDGASQLNGHNTGALRNVSGNNTYTGTITLKSNVTLGVDSGNQLTIAGTITDAGAPYNVVKELTGTLVYAGANTYGGGTFNIPNDNNAAFAGGTVVSQGVLNVRNNNALASFNGATTTTTVLDGAQLQLQGGVTISNELLRISGGGVNGTGALQSVGGANKWEGQVTLAQDEGFLPTPPTPPTAATVGVLYTTPSDGLTIDGKITDTVAEGLTKVGSGALTLNNNTNNYRGITTVTQGTLRIQQGGALGSAVAGTVVQPAQGVGAALELDSAPNAGGAFTVAGETLTLNGLGATEVQSITVTGGAGKFTLTFNGQTTPTALDYGASAFQVQQALNTLSSIGGVGGSVAVTQDPATGIYYVLFGGSLAGQDVSQITGAGQNGASVSTATVRQGATGAVRNISGNNTWSGGTVTIQTSSDLGADANSQLLIGSTVQDTQPKATVPAPSVTKVGTGTIAFGAADTYTGATFVNAGVLNIRNNSALGAVVSEVQSFTLTGSLTGSFTMTFKGQTTGSLSANYNDPNFAANVRSALEGLSTIGVGNVAVAQNPANKSTFTVTFQGALAGADQPQITATGTNGTSVTVSTVNDGSAGTVVASGATLQLQGGITVSTEPLVINGAGFNGIGALDSLSGNNTLGTTAPYNTAVTLGSASSLGAEAGATLTMLSPLVDNGNGSTFASPEVTKVGPGTLDYQVANTYTGLTQVNQGTLLLDNGSGMAILGNLTVGDGLPGAATATWNFSNEIPSSAIVTVNGDGTMNLNGKSQTLLSLAITDGTALTGAAGVLTLSGDASHSALSMNGGTLTAAAGGQVVLNGNVTATSSGNGTALINGAGTLSENGAVRTFTVNAGGKPIDLDVAALIVPGSGTPGLVKAGTGTMQIDPSNNSATFGAATVSAGTLQVDGTISDVILNGAANLGSLAAVLSGTGTVGNITVNSGQAGTVRPGDPADPVKHTGTLTAASMTLNPTSFFFTDLTNSAGNSLLQGTTAIHLNGATLVGAVDPAIQVGHQDFTIITGLRDATKFAQGDTAFVGGRKFTVTYNSNSVVLTADQMTVGVSLSSSDNPSHYGENVTFTANLTPEPGAGPVPDGEKVEFWLDNVDFGASTVSGGKATFTPDPAGNPALTVSGSPHTVQAQFVQDANYKPASNVPASLSQTVVPATSVANFSVSNPVYGATVPLTVVISAQAPGAGNPTGPTGPVALTVSGASPTTYNATLGAPHGSNPKNLTSTATVNVTGLTVGQHTVGINYNDTAADPNFSQLDNANAFTFTVSKADTSITLTANPASPSFGQSVTFTAQITNASPGSSGLPANGETVVFWDGSAILGNGTLSNGVASITVSGLSAGAHTIKAVYNGDGNFNGSTGYINNQTSNNFTVAGSQTSTSISSSANPSSLGAPVTFTATVTALPPGGGVPNGTVTFFVDNVAQTPSPNVDGTGHASLTVSDLTFGNHDVYAVYNPPASGANYASSTSPHMTQKVAFASSTSLTGPSAAVFGQPVGFTATVTAVAPASGTPTGTVTFFVDNVPQSPAQPVNGSGQASMVFTLGVGTHTITAAYTPDGASAFGPSTSPAQTITVTQASAGATLSSSANPSVYGQVVTFTMTVAATPPGGGTPDGTVTFVVDNAPQATVPVNASGQASFSIGTIGVGSHTVSAVYNGSGNFNGGATASVTQTVTKAGATTTVTASSSVANAGQPITYTATVRPNAPSGGVPTGSVVFVVDGVNQPSIVLNSSGQANLTLTFARGTHTISATYSGDGNFAGGPSANSVQTAVISNFKGSPNQVWVNEVYLDLLGRPADPNGLAFWSDQMEQQDVPRQTVVAGILNSDEYRQNYIVKLYQDLLNRTPLLPEIQVHLNDLRAGETYERLTANFLASPEYYLREGRQDPGVYTNAIYQYVLGHAASPAAVQFWTGFLQGGGTRLDMAMQILTSPEAYGVFVRKQYVNLLGRSPDGSPNPWFVALTQGARDEDVIIGIVSSQEYFMRLAANHNTQPQEAAYIASIYHDLLGRTIDPTSTNFWVGQFEQGLTRLRANEMAVNSAEYRGIVISGLFQKYLNRNPSPNDMSAYQGMLLQGQSVEQIKAQILGSSEYYFGHGGGTSFGFLNGLYHDVLGRALDDAGVVFWGDKLAGGEDRASLALEMNLTLDAEKAVVQGYYLAMLHRNADPVGQAYWAGLLQAGFPDDYVAAALAATDEYYHRATGG